MIVTEPKCAEKPVIVVSKINNYPVGQEITVDVGVTLIVMQDGKHVGYANNMLAKTPMQVTLNDKAFKDFRGLKKGLFSKEYKNVVLFWYHRTVDEITFNETVTTEKKHVGRFKGKLDIDFMSCNFDNLAATLKKADVKFDENSIIMSYSLLKEILRGRLIALMKVILDECPNYTFEAGVTNMPNVVKLITQDLDREMTKFGLPYGVHNFVKA